MHTAKPKLWTKDFIIMAAANFFVGLTFFILMTNLAVYALEEFQASPSKAGLASSIFIIGTLVFRVFAGKYIERTGRRKMLWGGLFLFLLATLLYFVVGNLNLLLLIRFLHGGAFGVTATAMTTIVMNIIPRERLGEGTSYFSMSGTLAMAVGPFLGVLISQKWDFNMIFVACTVFSLISIVISLFSHVPETRLSSEQLAAMQGFKWQNFLEGKAVPISIIIAIIGFSFSGVLSFLTSYTLEINLMDAASFFFVVYALFILISRPFTGRMFDVRGANPVIYPSLMIFALGLVVLSQAQQGYTLLLAGAIIGLGYGTLLSCCLAIAVKESPRHRIGLATSTFYICVDGGIGIGPFLLGYLIPVVSFRGLYVTLAVMVLACLPLYHLLHGKKEAGRKHHSLAH